MTTLNRNAIINGVLLITSNIVIKKGKVAAIYDVFGGPPTPVVGGDGFEAGPTDHGEFVIAGCWKHSSRRYPAWSGIPWGTPIRDSKSGIEVKVNSVWEPLINYSTVTKAEIEEYHNILYKSAKVPSAWKFNDFGHITCYIYKDVNRNKKFDKGSEQIHGEMFHTTPINEAQTELGLPVILEESHGCIHIKPKDIDEMIANGYLKKGNQVFIHSYSTTHPSRCIETSVMPPFVVHIFPGSKKLIVIGE